MMKKATLAALLAVGLVSVTRAQSLVIVTQRGETYVTVLDSPDGSTLDSSMKTVDVGGNSWDAMYLSGYEEIWITVPAANKIVILDKRTLAVKDTIDPAKITGLEAPKGLFFGPVSDAVFVAGKSGLYAAVYMISASTRGLVTTFVSDKNTDGGDDVAVREDKNVASTQTDLWVYMSVAGPTLVDGAVYGWSRLGGVTTALSPSQVQYPRQLAMPGVATHFLSSCQSVSSLGPSQLMKFDTGLDPVSSTNVDIGDPGATGIYSSAGVVFEPGTTTAWATASNGSPTWILERFDNGVPSGIPITLSAGVGGSRISYNPIDKKLYVGNTLPAGTSMEVISVATLIPTSLGTLTLGQGPHVAAVAPPNGPLKVFTAHPKGNLDGVGNKIRVEGQNFIPGAVVYAGPHLMNTQYVDSSTLIADTETFGNLSSNIIVENPDGKKAELAAFYVSHAGLTAPYTLQLPTAPEGYAMMSFPQYASLDDLKRGFEMAMGPYNPSLYRVFFWKRDRYIELDQIAPNDRDLCGEAFWVITRDGGRITLDAPDVLLNTTWYRVVPLAPGWNMISLPFYSLLTVMTPWGSVGVTADGSDIANTTPADSSPMLIAPELYGYWNGAYQIETSGMTAGRGYFVRNVTSSFIYLVFQSGGEMTAAEPLPVFAKSSSTPPPPPSGGLSEGRRNRCGFLGVEFAILYAFHLAFRRRRLGA